MALPYHCDTLLPKEKRWASERYQKFRRIKSLNFQMLAELSGFVRLVGPVPGIRLFQWPHWEYWHMISAMRDSTLIKASEPYYQANLRNLTFEDAIRIFEVMRENGWERGSVPQCVKDAAKELRGRGNTIAQTAKILQVSPQRIAAWTSPKTPTVSKRQRATAATAVAS